MIIPNGAWAIESPPDSPPDKILLRSSIVTVHHVLNEGLVRSPQLEPARAQLPLARAAIEQAKVFPNPGFMMDLQTQCTYKYGVTIPFEAPWLIMFRLMAARKQVKQADLELARVLWLFRGQVRQLYSELIMSSELANTQDQLVALTNKLHVYAQRRFEKGDVPRLDVHRTRLSVVQAELDSEVAHIQVERAREQLNILIGRIADQQMNLPPLSYESSGDDQSGLLPDLSRPMPSRKNLLQEAYKSRFELKVSNQAELVAEQQLKVARAEKFPKGEVNVGILIEDRINGPLERKTPFIQAKVLFPVFDRQQGKIASAKAQISQWSKTIIGQRNLIESEVALAYRKVEIARAKIRKYQKEALPVSNHITKSADLGYKLGQTDITAVIDMQQRNILLRTQYLQSILEYQLAINDLEQAVGRPLL
ncbi:MAG: TolC family protein [Candidatus Obscuribacterales bacterium]|nr:TolC family protein [Candidatus Obscuribacterales bacterium]